MGREKEGRDDGKGGGSGGKEMGVKEWKWKTTGRGIGGERKETVVARLASAPRSVNGHNSVIYAVCRGIHFKKQGNNSVLYSSLA